MTADTRHQQVSPANPLASPSTLFGEIEHMRGVIKWIIASLAAVGAVLAAGTQLSDLGNTQGNRLGLAVLAAAIALIGVVGAIREASRVLTPIRPLFGELANARTIRVNESRRSRKEREELEVVVDQLDRNTDAFVPLAEDVEDLYSQYKAALVQGQAGDAAARENAERLHNRAAQVVAIAEFYLIRNRFLRALRWLALYALVVAAGLITFSWAANPGNDSRTSALTAELPYRAIVDLTGPGKEALTLVLDDPCVEERMDVLVLARDGVLLEVETAAREGCPPVTLLLTPALGAVLVPQESGRP